VKFATNYSDSIPYPLISYVFPGLGAGKEHSNFCTVPDGSWHDSGQWEDHSSSQCESFSLQLLTLP